METSRNIIETLESTVDTIPLNFELKERMGSIEFSRLNFQPRSRTIRGREYPFYELTLDGFSFLVNKMTGPKAAEFTENLLG